ncbi:MAG: hypothetical protein AMS26_06900 [Bacteroides sp. SM23_62]|nr:MAG: hypothetical protein AMS26_06900 [Bacteroides sp. SM23_62]
MKIPGVVLTLLIAWSITLHAQLKDAPNIIFFLVDDLGYSDVGYMGQKANLNTPNIDQLAASGMVFTNAYAASPVCSPTRASILTGKYPATLQLTCHIPGIGIEPYATIRNKGQKLMEAEFIDHLPLKEVTFAEVLKEEGYVTAFIGKWHLAGEGSQNTQDGIVNARFHPDQQGFDVNIGGCAYGQPVSYFSPYENGTLTDGPDGEYLTDRLGEEACRFIEENNDHSFLLYLSFYTVHSPYQAPGKVVNKYNGNIYFAMLEKLDENVGKVLSTVRTLELEKSTLVVFYSDNGGVGSNPPLRSGKGSLYEGGIRVPLLFSMPGLVPDNKICDVPVTSTDLFPTLLDAAGISSNQCKQVEGESLWPLITRRGNIQERALYWHFPHHRDIEKSMSAAIRDGDWKLIREFEGEELSLYNLEDDIGETRNLAGKYPKKVNLLFAKLGKWLRQTNARMPQPNTITLAIQE